MHLQRRWMPRPETLHGRESNEILPVAVGCASGAIANRRRAALPAPLITYKKGGVVAAACRHAAVLCNKSLSVMVRVSEAFTPRNAIGVPGGSTRVCLPEGALRRTEAIAAARICSRCKLRTYFFQRALLPAGANGLPFLHHPRARRDGTRRQAEVRSGDERVRHHRTRRPLGRSRIAGAITACGKAEEHGGRQCLSDRSGQWSGSLSIHDRLSDR